MQMKRGRGILTTRTMRRRDALFLFCCGSLFVKDMLLTLLSQLNDLILDYLDIQGYKEAAELFSEEAHVAYKSNSAALQVRLDVRASILHGDVFGAINRLNLYNPEVRTVPKQHCIRGIEKKKNVSCTTLSFRAMRSQKT